MAVQLTAKSGTVACDFVSLDIWKADIREEFVSRLSCANIRGL
jgi:hypothetical protein